MGGVSCFHDACMHYYMTATGTAGEAQSPSQATGQRPMRSVVPRHPTLKPASLPLAAALHTWMEIVLWVNNQQ